MTSAFLLCLEEQPDGAYTPHNSNNFKVKWIAQLLLYLNCKNFLQALQSQYIARNTLVFFDTYQQCVILFKPASQTGCTCAQFPVNLYLSRQLKIMHCPECSEVTQHFNFWVMICNEIITYRYIIWAFSPFTLKREQIAKSYSERLSHVASDFMKWWWRRQQITAIMHCFTLDKVILSPSEHTQQQ